MVYIVLITQGYPIPFVIKQKYIHRERVSDIRFPFVIKMIYIMGHLIIYIYKPSFHMTSNSAMKQISKLFSFRKGILYSTLYQKRFIRNLLEVTGRYHYLAFQYP